MKYINRDIEKTVKQYLKQFSVLALTGARQTGKTTLLKKIFTKKYKYISFDDILIRERAIDDPKLFLEEIGLYVILDEIQYVPSLLSYLKIIIDNNREKKGIFILTGSQQFNLIKNIGDTLAGRIGILNLLTFNSNELKKSSDLKNDKEIFTTECLSGTYPQNVVEKTKYSYRWYSSYIQTYLERDVKGIYNIGALRDFQRFLQLLCARCSQILNVSSFAKEIGVSVSAINNWLSILEASQIIYLLKPYYNNLGKRIIKKPKVYFFDCGLVCFFTGIRTEEHIFNGPLAGALFENYCISEILKKYFNQGEKENIYYLRTHNDLEIDLLVEKNFNIIPIEIKLTKTPKISMCKNIERAIKLFAKLKIKKGKIMCLTDEAFKLTENIECINPSQINKKNFLI